MQENDGWYLEPYQRIPGQATSFLDHIQRGYVSFHSKFPPNFTQAKFHSNFCGARFLCRIELTENDPDALLLFSGGVTRKDAGPRSEGQSYWIVADSNNWFGREFEFFQNFEEFTKYKFLFLRKSSELSM